MNTPQTLDSDAPFDPLDMVESILTEEGLEFERTPEGDLGFALAGDWRTYEMWFSWRPEGECLQLCCSLDVESGVGVPLAENRLGGLYELLCLVNSHVWFGHFEVFRDTEAADGQGVYDVIFRHTVALNPLERASVMASAHMINSAAEAVDRFFPAFDFWFKGVSTASDAFAACLFETKGEA
ncbi:YbjN domain-containing protein [Asticcacaulis taihuensis]|jgi:hypothetical protein|uniref:Sensory transduction regulator n=1 Tax=Asticcacaulis taihuensis TaxID=260084 RepID=A0A1G4Q6V8_9CAUL|nr:YbjN domain-containing protein [Asticcacaulis taihuensis]SCW40088.1 hypothetical protein SAMN02927928_0950 [Asticcacaulis taihuensis]